MLGVTLTTCEQRAIYDECYKAMFPITNTPLERLKWLKNQWEIHFENCTIYRYIGHRIEDKENGLAFETEWDTSKGW